MKFQLRKNGKVNLEISNIAYKFFLRNRGLLYLNHLAGVFLSGKPFSCKDLFAFRKANLKMFFP